MSGIMTAVATVAKVAKIVSDNEAHSPAKIIAEVLKRDKEIGLIRTDGSITKLLSRYIVEPMIIATKNSKDTEVFDKLTQLNTDIFCSFYMQAFEVLKNISGIDMNIAIDLLGTDNASLKSLGYKQVRDKFIQNFEENKDYLSMLNNNGSKVSLRFSMEADIRAKDIGLNFKSKSDLKTDAEDDDMLYGVLQRNVDLKCHIIKTIDGHKAEHIVNIPITIKAGVIVVPTSSLLNMLTPVTRDKTYGWRLDEYRSGAISLSELIFASDLIKEYKKTKLDDKDKLLDLLDRKKMSANIKLVDYNAVGFEKYYNMIIMTSDDKVRFDKKLNGDITKESNKQKLLDECLGLTLSIIDTDYERVSVYTKDIRGSSDIGYKTLLKRKDKGDSDMVEIMKSIMMNKPISF